MGFLGIFLKNTKNTHIVRQLRPPEWVSEFSFCFYVVAFSIGYIVVYSIFFLGAVLEEKFAKQNASFEGVKLISQDLSNQILIRKNPRTISSMCQKVMSFSLLLGRVKPIVLGFSRIRLRSERIPGR